MHIDVAMDQLKGLISYFKGYRENEFTSATNSSKKKNCIGNGNRTCYFVRNV